MQPSEYYGRLAGQDRKDFPLGTCPARPAAGYFADAVGLADEQVIKDAIAGLSTEHEIESALRELLGRVHAHGYMWWRLGIKKYAPRP
ncbi:hypothetical protein [Bradyrhizobium sp.]|uniref:hypothetical protein n=1 Tax=Bradyrhizobium sp. TaxID=376 RepID=UPI002628C1E6|nr:hypothetical protein [Bradyrhizobium sp.]